MSFKVESESLSEFALYLEGCGDDADEIEWLISHETDLGPLGEGIYAKVAGIHFDIQRAMIDRAVLLATTSSDCAWAMEDTASLYDKVDKSEAESLDASYEGASGGGTPSEATGGSKTGSFEYHSVSDELDIKKKPSDIEPKAGEIEERLRFVLDSGSPSAQLRYLILETFGIDPIDWLRSWFTGDWKAFAKCSLAWGVCADALEQMYEDFGAALTKIPQVWEGNAADEAVAYFTKYRDALKVEAEAFRFWEDMYRDHMELVYECWKLCNDILNFVFDGLLAFCTGGASLIAEAIQGLMNGNSLYDKISRALGKLGVIGTSLIDACQIFETFASQIGTAFEGYATSILPKLPDAKGDGDSSYDRPYPDKRVDAPPMYQEN